MRPLPFRPRPRRAIRRGAICAAVVLGVSVLAGCSGGLSETGEPLTTAQSELLAQARFQLGQTEDYVAHVQLGDPESDSHAVADLTVDATEHRAWGTVKRGPEGLAVEQRVLLTTDWYAWNSAEGWQASGWGQGDLAPMIIVFSLSADRPENAQLLQQSDARYLGTEDDLEVYRLPSSTEGSEAVTRLWLDDNKLARLDNGTDDLVITVDESATPEPLPDDLAALIESAK